MQSTQEIWKDIPGLENRYEVSITGKVRNKRTGHVLKTPVNYKSTGVGYNRFTTISQNVLRYHYVQRVVMEAFCPHPDSHNLTVNHKDFNRQNNHLDNLEWCTMSENIQYSHDNGRHDEARKLSSIRMKRMVAEGKNWLVNYNTGKKGERALGSKLKDSDIPKIRLMRKEGHSCNSIAKMFGVCHQSISNITLGKSWSHVL
jgi:hypothetical protein